MPTMPIRTRSAAVTEADLLTAFAEEGGAMPALVCHLKVPPTAPVMEEEQQPRPFEHEVEKGAAFALGLLAVKPEHQQLIVDAGALPLLVNLLRRHKNATNSRAVNSLIRRADDAITNLSHENSNIKTCIRIEGGIPPLVELLESQDIKVQRATAGALRTLAFKNDENKSLIVDCNALPTLILMLRSEYSAIHYEAARWRWRSARARGHTGGAPLLPGFSMRSQVVPPVEVVQLLNGF